MSVWYQQLISLYSIFLLRIRTLFPEQRMKLDQNTKTRVRSADEVVHIFNVRQVGSFTHQVLSAREEAY
jgi:hypothetical protein